MLLYQKKNQTNQHSKLYILQGGIIPRIGVWQNLAELLTLEVDDNNLSASLYYSTTIRSYIISYIGFRQVGFQKEYKCNL